MNATDSINRLTPFYPQAPVAQRLAPCALPLTSSAQQEHIATLTAELATVTRELHALRRASLARARIDSVTVREITTASAVWHRVTPPRLRLHERLILWLARVLGS